jgi:TetR/AcrR family transcriptional repressor of mexJK operon
MYSIFCRPKEALRRAAILQVAHELFSEVGYAATSMSSIAARLGGSKATLYKYFRSKEELFAASLEDLIATHAGDLLLPATNGDDLEKTLSLICRKVTAAMLSPPLLALLRLVVAESPRFPELGRAYYDKVVAPGQQRIAAYLQSCVEKHLIRPVDPLVAACQLLALCRTNSHFRALANVAPAPTAAELTAEADAAAATFLAAFKL